MIKPTLTILLALVLFICRSQEVSLPADLRQHALTQYNASLFNPAFSLDRNNPQSLSIWTRWQWQSIDADPTTLFVNYTRTLNEKSAAGIGFFQHNTGIYFNTGGVVNYAYSIKLNPIIKLSIGANLFGFNQSLADTRFQPDPNVLPVPLQITDDFILQLAPGFNLSVENFSLSMASENLFDYNMRNKASNTDKGDKIFMGMASYDISVFASDSTAFLRPSIYLRTIPEEENQIGMNALLSTRSYWAQTGYNNFYGISVGAGATVFNRISLGALMEFGTSSSLNSKDSSFEIIASYFLGNPKDRRKPVVNVFDALDQQVVVVDEEVNAANVQEPETPKVIPDEEKNEEVENKAVIAERELPKEKESSKVGQTNDNAKALEKERRKDSIASIKKEKDILAKAKKESAVKAKVEAAEAKKSAALADKEKADKTKKDIADEEFEKNQQIAKNEALKTAQNQDSIAKVKAYDDAQAMKIKEAADKEIEAEEDTLPKEKEKITLQAGEKYEEVATVEGLEPGFYLIANVFGTKKYFDAFMQDLRKKGIEPGSFVKGKNNYNYVYLKRYDTISEARNARDSKFNGKYQDKTWIFRVIGE
ncbi:MAG: PorP/SprF family type IX secretion system membrane protein [Flavobacteriaceae bacterium]